MPLLIFSVGRGIPITPVEEGKTSLGSILNRKPASRHAASASPRPWLPVHALALPLLTTTAWRTPRFIRFNPTKTGAALTLFVVKRAAAVAGRSENITAKSFFRLFLMPQAIPANLNPGTVTLAIELPDLTCCSLPFSQVKGPGPKEGRRSSHYFV